MTKPPNSYLKYILNRSAKTAVHESEKSLHDCTEAQSKYEMTCSAMPECLPMTTFVIKDSISEEETSNNQCVALVGGGISGHCLQRSTLYTVHSKRERPFMLSLA